MILGQDGTAATQPTTEETTAWYDLVGKFRNAANSFMTMWNNLLAQQAYVNTRPALKSDYTALMSRGASLRGTIQSTMNTIQLALAWLKSWFGLGIIPLIPIAVLAGSLALVTKWVFDARTMQARIDEQKRLEAQGVSPSEASRIVSQTAGPPPSGFFETISKNVTTIVIGAFVVGGVVYLARSGRLRAS